MTTPAVPVVRNIRDLRRLFDESVLNIGYVRRNGLSAYTALVSEGPWCPRKEVSGGWYPTAADAARALAERLVAAGYEAKEE